MKSKELLSYLSDVDEKYLADADLSAADPKSPRRFKWLILVPAAVLLIAAVSIPILVIMHRGQPAAPDPVTDPVASETVTEKSNIATEEVSLCFESIDELNQALKEYKDNKEMQTDRRYIYNKFDELTINHNPTVNSDKYELLRIEVNPYRVFYYYVPVGAKSFEYETGIVVTFIREIEATIETVGSQLNASYEPDGSFFDEQNRTWFIPLDGSYYSIRFPADMENCDKSIVAFNDE